MRITSLLLLFTLISCGSKDNIFFKEDSNVSNVIGSILPAEAQPEVLVSSPAQGELSGVEVELLGQCINSTKVEITHPELKTDPTIVDCLNESFKANLEFTNTADKLFEIEVRAINTTKIASVKKELNIKIEKPSFSSHIDTTKKRATSITLDWNNSTSTNLPLKGYILEYKRADETAWQSTNPVVTTTTSKEVTGLAPSTQYDFRVKAFNGNSSEYSQTSDKTTPQNDFFNEQIKAFNIAGATKSSLVAIESGDFYLNGNLLVTLNKGQTHQFDSNQFDKLSSDKAFFIAGLKSVGNGANRNGNMVWTTQDWAHKDFSFVASRSARHKLSIVAYEPSSITVKRGADIISTITLSSDQGSVVDLPTNANYTIESTGTISASLYSATNANNQIQDPRPLLPNSTDLVGIPSRQGFVSSATINNKITGTHSNDIEFTHTFANLSSLYKITVQGSADRYKSEAVRLQSTNPIEAISNADFDGYASAPFVPRAKMKTTYAVNVESAWVAFVSIEPGIVTITKPDGSVSTANLTRSGSKDLAPYKARLTNIPAGTIFTSTVKMGAWYEPTSDSYGANDDETLLFGYDL